MHPEFLTLFDCWSFDFPYLALILYKHVLGKMYSFSLSLSVRAVFMQGSDDEEEVVSTPPSSEESGSDWKTLMTDTLKGEWKKTPCPFHHSVHDLMKSWYSTYYSITSLSFVLSCQDFHKHFVYTFGSVDINGIVHPEMKILSSFTYHHVVLNP